MDVKWNKRGHLRPNILLHKLVSFRAVATDGSVSYSESSYFEYFEVLAVLNGLLIFPEKCDGLDRERVLSSALENLTNDQLNEKGVEKEINRLVKHDLASRERKYFYLTSISLASPSPIKCIKIQGVSIRILPGEYPAKYSSRLELLESNGKEESGTRVYSKVIVSVKDRSPRGGERKACEALDLLRATMCFIANSDMEIEFFGSNQWSPINKIRLGEFHTIHLDSGKSFNDMFWFEPNFGMSTSYKPTSEKKFSQKVKNMISRIDSLGYSEAIKRAMLRYVRALDERDKNVAIMKLWSAIEVLTLPSGENYDLLTRRCSFLFKEAEYHKQVLEYIREYRNSNVHSGEENDKVKSYCYLLQRYFRVLVRFHLRSSTNFGTLAEANQFLDLPADKEKLEMTKKRIEDAISFRGP